MRNAAALRPRMVVRSEAPYNAEPAPDRLCASITTAQSDFYIRNHGNIPHIDASRHHLHVGGRVRAPLDIPVRELRKRFPERTITAVMQCAGNRRADMQRVRPTSGLPWTSGAIGNAAWTGVALADVLRAAGVQINPAYHVAFDACDQVEKPRVGRFAYGASIPLAKAMSSEVLLAYSMNDEPLTPEHGFPLRVVVPGFAGVRSTKWLAAITVQDKPSDNHIQQREYKLMPPDVTEETADWRQGATIYAMRLNSAICEPASRAELKAGSVTLRGYATATDGRIAQVEVSSDGGQTWMQAELEHNVDEPWSWTLWTATLGLVKGDHELAVRAWDSAGQTQPASPDEIWNCKGYLSTAWHRVPVSVS